MRGLLLVVCIYLFNVVVFAVPISIASVNRAGTTTTATTVDLGGTNWLVNNRNSSIKISGTVPGNVHTDLLAAKKIGDPYFGYNYVNQKWVYWEDWSYSKNFTLTSQVTSQKKVLLECDGLDTVADVYVNGKKLGSTNNMFLKYSYDVTGVVVAGSNSIKIQFFSAPAYAQSQAKAYPYVVPANRFPFDEPSRNFIRKEQASFGWDWGPMFATQGIWRPIRIVAIADAVIQESSIQTYPNTIPPTSFTVKIDAWVLAATTLADGSVVVEVAGVKGSSKPAALTVGLNHITFNITVDSPKLWWPNGYGSQSLYPLTIGLNVGGSIVNQVNKVTGFKTVEVVQDDLADGKSFYFRINGVPIYAKGANWIPADAFENRVTEDTIQDLLQSAADANMNIVRNWGGGIYQQDVFYDTADKLGLMVWQEFMFACGMYPRDKAFLSNVVSEMTYQVRRLSHHASIILWSGNNENEVALGGWYEEVNKNRVLYGVDYAELYLNTIYPTIKQEDPSHPFWPSSPSNGLLSENPVVGRWGDAGSLTYGDVHYYNNVADCTDVSKLPRTRFTSEYGFQSSPSIFAWQQVSPSAADMVFNGTFAAHREHGSGGVDGQLLTQMKIHFKLPANVNDPSQFENYIYLSQCMQALCIKSESEHYRRIKGDDAKNMGAIYWQLNDIWQGPTWSSIEYGGRWKMLHYYVRSFFAPVLVSSYEDPVDNFGVYITSDRVESITGKLIVTLWTWTGLKQSSYNTTFSLQSLESKNIYKNKISTMLGTHPTCANRADCFFELQAVDQNNALLSKNVFYLSSLAVASLKKPVITFGKFVQTSPTQVSFQAVTNVPAPYVFLQTKFAGVFSDNGVLLLPNTTLSLTFTGKQNIDAATLSASLTYKSIASTY